MATTTMIVDCGLLGEQELTISYKAHKGFKGTYFEPAEIESASIYWIKFGGFEGIEVELPDDFINDEVIPHCLDDHNEMAEAAFEEKAERMREEWRMKHERLNS